MTLDEILDGIQEEQAELLGQLILTDDRMEHLDGCIEAAYDLALQYGLDCRKAVLAALLHDFYREKDEQEILGLAAENGVRPTPFETRYYKVLHGKVAAAYFARKGYIRDEGILEAVAHHTLAAPDIGPLARLMFIVDAVEPFRKYKGVEEIRAFVYSHGLDGSYAHVLARQIMDMAAKGKILPRATVEAYNQIMEETKE